LGETSLLPSLHSALKLTLTSLHSLLSISRRGIQLFSSLTASAQQVLPTRLSSAFEPKRDFAFCKLPASAKGLANICAMGQCVAELARRKGETLTLRFRGSLNLAQGLNQPHSVMLVTSDGYFYQYAMDPIAGGECKLDRTYRLVWFRAPSPF
jgi:autophagy-related protein 18